MEFWQKHSKQEMYYAQTYLKIQDINDLYYIKSDHHNDHKLLSIILF